MELSRKPVPVIVFGHLRSKDAAPHVEPEQHLAALCYSLSAMGDQEQSPAPFAFLAARAHCWLMLSLLAPALPCPFLLSCSPATHPQFEPVPRIALSQVQNPAGILVKFHAIAASLHSPEKTFVPKESSEHFLSSVNLLSMYSMLASTSSIKT